MPVLRPFTITASVLVAHVSWGSCLHSTPRSAEVEAAGAKKVVVSAGAGDLIITGDAATSLVHATGDACGENAQTLEGVQIEVRRNGDTVYVTAVMPQHSPFQQASLDLKVAMPAGAAVEVEDSSGDIVVKNVAGAKVDDSSGDQTIRDIAGDVAVQDSSGDIVIEGVRGNVEVRDSSGEIKVVNIGGNVTIPVDSSGGMTIARVRGNVHVLNDSAGDIVLEDINQNANIDRDGAGDIRAANIGGDFTVADDGTGDISHRNVLGRVSTPD